MTVVTFEELNKILKDSGITETQAKAFADVLSKTTVKTSVGLETRVAKVESDVAHIQQDIIDLKADIKELRGDIKSLTKEVSSNFKALLFFIVANTGSILAVMAHGFHWL